MTDNDKKEIKILYFQEMKTYTQIMEHFNNKYSYAEIKSVLNSVYKNKEN